MWFSMRCSVAARRILAVFQAEALGEAWCERERRAS
jgi:hypothetical protein